MITSNSRRSPNKPLHPELLRRQKDWEDILDNSALLEDPQLHVETDNDRENVKEARNTLSVISSANLAFVWFTSAKHCLNIKIPKTESEFRNYGIYQSSAWGWVVFLCTVVLLAGPFLAQPECTFSVDYHIYRSSKDQSDQKTTGIPVYVLSGLYLSCMIVQNIDVYLWCKSSSWVNLFDGKTRMNIETNHIWVFVKGLSAFAIFMDCFLYFFLSTTPRITRCLAPVLYISRSENMKAIVEGFLTAIRKALPVFQMLVLVLMLWAFFGLYFFQRLDIARHFVSYFSALLTCLHCFSSRPTVLDRILQLWHFTNASAFYFVILTLFADMIVGTFLVAVGNKYYRDFIMLTFRRRLRYRRRALMAIFYLYCEISGDRRSRTSTISLSSWLEFSCSIPSVGSSLSRTETIRREAAGIFHLEDTEGTGRVDMKSFFRMALLLTVLIDNPEMTFTHNAACIEDREVNATDNANDLEMSTISPSTTEPHLTPHLTPSLAAFPPTRSTPSSFSSSPNPPPSPVAKLHASSFQLFKNWCKQIDAMSFRVYQYDVNILTATTSIALLILIVQLSFISQAHPSYNWFVLGWFNLAYFTFDTTIKYFSDDKNRKAIFLAAMVNFGTFISKCFIGPDMSNINQRALTFVILFQSMRSLRIFTFIPNVEDLVAIVPVIARVALLISLYIFTFAIIGHVLFCSSMDPSKVAAVHISDDDSLRWIPFSNLLNFSTLFQSAFTLAEVALLSNWSVVMDAARVSSNSHNALLFFYVFRLSVTLSILPILMSFIIQSFSRQVSKREQMKLLKLEKSNGQQEAQISANFTVANHDNYKPYSSVMIQLWSPDDRETVVNRNISTPATLATAKARELLARVNEAKQEFQRIKDALLHLLEKASSRPGPLDLAVRRVLDSIQQKSFFVEDPTVLTEVASWGKLKDQQSEEATTDARTHMETVCANLRVTLPADDLPILYALWVKNALGGYDLQLPPTALHLRACQLFRSTGMRYAVNTAVILHLVLVLAEPMGCGRVHFSSHPLVVATTVLGFCTSCVYAVDSIVHMYVTQSQSHHSSSHGHSSSLMGTVKSWAFLRLLCSIAIIVDLVVSYSSGILIAYTRCLFSIFIVGRELNTRQMVEGISHAVYRARNIYLLLFSILVVWSFLGFFLFQRYETKAERFHNPLVSFYTCLHVFSSAPFGLVVLEPYWKISELSALFFLFLTLNAEVLGNALIISVANGELKKFADKNLVHRLNCRRANLSALWLCCSTNDRLSVEAWLELCAMLSAHRSIFRIDLESARDLFDYVRLETSCNTDFHKNEAIDERQFFALVGLVSAGVRSNRRIELEKSVADLADIQRMSKLDGDNPMHQKGDSRTRSRSRTSSDSSQPEQQQYAGSTASPLFDEIQANRHRVNLGIPSSKSSILQRVFLSIAPNFSRAVYRMCLEIMQFELKLVCRWGVFECCNLVMHGILALQLAFVSSKADVSKSWINAGVFLQIYFWLDLFVRMVVLGELSFLRPGKNSVQLVCNIGSSICSVILDGNFYELSTVMVMYFLFQSVRLFRMVFSLTNFDGDKTADLQATLTKVLILLFLFIYSFAALGQPLFCEALSNPVSAASADDDIGIWNANASILNFDNVFQAMFCLFEISVLGTWSQVMDAAARSNVTSPASAYIFFYSFRLLISLVVVPLLMSFVIRSFVTLGDGNSAEAALLKELTMEKDNDGKLRVMINRASTLQLAQQDKFQSSVEQTEADVEKEEQKVDGTGLIPEQSSLLMLMSTSLRGGVRLAWTALLRYVLSFEGAAVLTFESTIEQKGSFSFLDIWAPGDRRLEKNVMVGMVSMEANNIEMNARYLREVLAALQNEIFPESTTLQTPSSEVGGLHNSSKAKTGRDL